MENNKIHEIRLIVAGTRTFDDYVLMKEKLDRIILGLREDYSGAPVPRPVAPVRQSCRSHAKCPDVSVREGRHSSAGCILGWKKPRN